MSGRVHVERPDRRLDLARELLEHQVLVLHLGDEPRRLEQPLAVPAAERRARRRRAVHWASAATPVGDVSVGQDVLDVVHQPVVLGVEDLVDGRQRDVLVAPAVTAGEVRVEHLVVVGAGRLVRRSRPTACCRRPAIGATGGVAGLLSVSCGDGSALCAMSVRNGVSKCATFAGTGTGLARLPSTRRHRRRLPSPRHVLRQPAQRAGDELAVRVGGDHRDVGHVPVDELQAEHVGGLLLDRRPGRRYPSSRRASSV